MLVSGESLYCSTLQLMKILLLQTRLCTESYTHLVTEQITTVHWNNFTFRLISALWWNITAIIRETAVRNAKLHALNVCA